MKLPPHLEVPDPNIYNKNNYLVLDFETDGFPLDGGRIVLTGYKKNNQPYQSIWGDKYALAPLFTELDSCEFLVCQNAKFELQWLQLSGYDIGRLVVYDTMLGEYCILGNRFGRKDLSTLGEKYCGSGKKDLVGTLFSGGAKSSEIPTHWLKDYNQRDVELTEHVFLLQREILRRDGLLPVFFTRCLTTIPLADIELRGVCLDAGRVKERLDETTKEYNEAKRELDDIAGGINWNSSKQVGELIYERLGFSEPIDHRGEVSRTDGGNRRTDEGVLSQLTATTTLQRDFKRAFLAYRKLDLAYRNLSKLQKCCEVDGSTLYASFNQAITQTHRLSSGGGKYKFQFQNIDRSFKSLFRARHSGWTIAEADGRQLEFRVAVHLGRDKQGLIDVKSGFDVHRNTASILNRVPLGSVTKEQRQAAKPETFKPLYGGQSGTKSQRAYYAAFRKRYKDTYETQLGWCREVLKTGQLRIASGLIFYWESKQTKTGYITNTPSIFNYPVQSFATADIIPISLVYLWHLMRCMNMSSFLVNTVHDSVIAELESNEKETFNNLCQRAFTSDVFQYLKAVYGISFTCPLGVETKIGSYWGEGTGINYDEEPM